MPKICYIEKRFTSAHQRIIQTANQILAEYEAKGYELTLRQLYYQFVARDIIANNQREYKNLGNIINDARLAGVIDWTAILTAPATSAGRRPCKRNRLAATRSRRPPTK